MATHNVHYSKRGDAVVISQPHQPDIVLNEPNLALAIETVKRVRSSFVTEEVYRLMLSMYVDAQQFLKESAASPPR